MLPELSLNVLDIAYNSIAAHAKQIEITITISTINNLLSLTIKDDGCGMDDEMIKKVEDPFFTTRTTRSVGLGIPFLKQSALAANGTFFIDSKQGTGTTVFVTYELSHIDRMPLGDITSTIHTLITYNSTIDFIYTYTFDSRTFQLNTKELRRILGDIPFQIPEVSSYIKEYLTENKKEADGGRIL